MANKPYRNVEVSSWAFLEASGNITISIKYQAKHGDKRVTGTEDISGDKLMMSLFNSGLIDGWSKNNVFARQVTMSISPEGIQECVKVDLRNASEFIKALEDGDVLILLCDSLNDKQ